MKKSLVLVAAFASLLLLVGQAAGAHRAASARTVTVVMRDPGCHWFAVGGKFLKTLSVKGPVSLANYDMASLKIVGPSGAKLAALGKKVALAHGAYRITMVGQAKDDNTLMLTVR